MAIYKRGETYWFKFIFKGRYVRESTHQGNPNEARNIESARRTQLAKGEVGLIDKPAVPTLKEFAPRFEKAIENACKDKPATVVFYKEKLRRLLGFAPLASRRLDEIDEEFVENLKSQRTGQISRYGRPVSIASVNRELATLRRLLRLAHEWKVLGRVPRIRLFRGEVGREFVLSYSLEELYLHMAPQPLKDVAMLILDTGARPGEIAALEWRHVHLRPAAGAKLGYIEIVRGKSVKAKRNLSLTERAVTMLRARRTLDAKSKLVFPARSGAPRPVAVTSLDHDHDVFRAVLGLPPDFVIHSLRHTMLTRLGESGADAFTIMRIAGHSNVTTSQRYVHPSPESLERAFERMAALNDARRQEQAKAPGTKSGTDAKITLAASG
jgi:integrase